MRRKTGFVFSGAAARIAQEAALAEALTEGLTPSGKKIRPDVVAGTSSGALNAVAINAILKTKDGQIQGNQAFGWEDYKRVLFELETGKVFDVTAKGIARIVANNLIAGFVLDTDPLRKLLEDMVVERMGFETLGSLYIPTYISVVEHKTGSIHRLFSRDPNPNIRDLRLVDVLMATTAIPGAFKPQEIKGLETEFIDGGVGRDGIPVEAIAKERCKELYLISRMRGRTPINLVIPKVLKQPPKILETSLLAFQFFTDDFFQVEIEKASSIASHAFLYIPDLSKNYSMLDFSTQKEQYEETLAWAKRNDPVRINAYRT